MSLPRELAVAALFVPFALWYWPRWIVRDFVAGYREARDARQRKARRS